jgi:hypothetical protein
VSKEATVERTKMASCVACGSSEWHAKGSHACQAEMARRALEKAWDEGYYIGVRAREDADGLGPDVNPYRPEPAKGDSK